jgi:hypothetical protein
MKLMRKSRCGKIGFLMESPAICFAIKKIILKNTFLNYYPLIIINQIKTIKFPVKGFSPFLKFSIPCSNILKLFITATVINV